jgi:hypothetical protein
MYILGTRQARPANSNHMMHQWIGELGSDAELGTCLGCFTFRASSSVVQLVKNFYEKLRRHQV